MSDARTLIASIVSKYSKCHECYIPVGRLCGRCLAEADAIIPALKSAGYVVLKNRECPDCGDPDGWEEHLCA